MNWQQPEQIRLPARSIWRRAERELRAKPGEWALVLEDEQPTYARTSCARLLRRYGCETCTRITTDDGRVSVWARWNPVENPGRSIDPQGARGSIDA